MTGHSHHLVGTYLTIVNIKLIFVFSVDFFSPAILIIENCASTQQDYYHVVPASSVIITSQHANFFWDAIITVWVCRLHIRGQSRLIPSLVPRLPNLFNARFFLQVKKAERGLGTRLSDPHARLVYLRTLI